MKIKKQSGFTLIEVIVVAVIIAVLSAVAIPLYNGYINESRKNTAENVAGSAASFIGTAYATLGSEDSVKVADGSTTITLPNNTWIYSDKSKKSELLAIIGADTNRFIIPTDIQIRVTKATSTVIGAHVKSVLERGTPKQPGGSPAGRDTTQGYHYH